MPILKNIKTGKEKFFSQEDFVSALGSGWRMRAGDTAMMIEPITGDKITVDAANVDQYVTQGIRPEGTASIRGRAREHRLESKYGSGFWNTSQALLEGIGRGLSFGGTDALAVAMGADEEGLSERRGRSPIASMGGEIGGALLPLLFTGGMSGIASGAKAGASLGKAGTSVGRASMAGKAISYTPAAIALKLGTRAGQATGRAMGGMATGGRFARAGAAAAPWAVQGGVEGTMYGAGMGLSETVLSSDPFSAEALVSNMTSGALYGGGLGFAAGGAFGLLAHGASGIKAIRAQAAERRLAKAEKNIAKSGGKGKTSAAEKSGEREFNEGLDAMTRSGSDLESWAILSRNKGGPFGKSYDDAFEELTVARDRFENAGFHVEGKLEKITNGNLEKLSAMEPARYNAIIDVVEEYRIAQVRMAEELIGAGGSALRPGSSAAGDMLHPGQYMKMVKAGEHMAVVRTTQAATEGIHGVEKLALINEASDELTGVGADDLPVVGRLADAYLKLHIGALILGKAGLPGARAIMGGKALKGAGGAVAKAMGFSGKAKGVQTWAASAYTSTTDKIIKGVNAFARAGKRGGHYTALAVLQRASFADRETGPGRPTKTRAGMTPLQRAFADRSKEINTSMNDIEGTAKRLMRATRDFSANDPKLGQQMMSLAMRKLAYLANKMPKGPQHGGLGSPFSADYVPSDMEIAKFARIVNAIENPMQVLKNMASMTLTPDESKAVKDVYPEIYRKIQMQILDTLSNIETPMSFPKLIQLSILWDLPVHSAMRPEFQNRLRYTFTTQEQQPPQTQMANLKSSAESAHTTVQRMAQK